jgi:hypothetical protein
VAAGHNRFHAGGISGMRGSTGPWDSGLMLVESRALR